MDDHGPGAWLSGSGNRGRGWIIIGVAVGGLTACSAGRPGSSRHFMIVVAGVRLSSLSYHDHEIS